MARDEEMRMLRLAARREKRAREIAERDRVMISVAKFAEIAGCSRSTIDRLRKTRPEGFPTEYAPWGPPRFKREEVEAWLQAQPLW